MTKEVVIANLKADIKYWENTSVDTEHLQIAVKAMKQYGILDKIKEDVKKWYFQADKQKLAEDPCVVDAMIDLFIRTIDKYNEESEVEDGKFSKNNR